MKMSAKQICGIVAVIIGIGLLIYGFYGANEMRKSREDIDQYMGYVPKGKFRGYVSGGLHGKVDEYKMPVILLFVGGVVFVVGGGICFYFGSRGRSRR